MFFIGGRNVSIFAEKAVLIEAVFRIPYYAVIQIRNTGNFNP